jgi:hypothetical protein
VAFNLYTGFVKAKAHFNAKLVDSIPSALFFGKEYLTMTQEVFGVDPFPYGVKANRKLLETLIDFSHEQGLTKNKMKNRRTVRGEHAGPLRVGVMEYWSVGMMGRWSLPFATTVKRTLAVVVALCCFAASTVSAKPVTFAYQTPTLNSTLPLQVGQDFGFFAAEGLEVKTVFIRGGPTAIAALVGGDVDYTLVAGVPAVRAIVQGAPLLIVSGMQPYMDYTLMGAKGINQVNDLKGKIVGVTGAGGIAEYAAVEGLSKKGLVRDRDYKVLYGVGNSPARAQSLELGRIHASPFSFLERLELEQKGFPILFDIGKVLPDFRLS